MIKAKGVYRLAIDGNEANVKHRVGSNVYAFEVIKHLETITQSRPHIDITILLAADPLPDLPPARAGWSYRVVGPKPMWTQVGLPLHLFLNQNHYDVFFTPGHYAPRLASVPYVSSVMDLAFLVYPEQFRKKDLIQLKEWTAYSVKHAQKIIAISQATKEDVTKYYHRPARDVVVAYPSISGTQQPAAPDELQAFMKRHQIKAPFILYIGTLQPRKNLVRLVEAFNLVASRWPSQQLRKRLKPAHQAGVQLVIAGKVGWLADEATRAIEASPFKKDIITTGYVSDELKYGLYSQAACSVLVGLYEGFGIPPLESLAMGTVPVVSDTTSLPEVVGRAGILVDPYQVGEIAQGLIQALTLSAKERGQYRRYAREQLKKFDWQTTAETILDTLLKVAHPK